MGILMELLGHGVLRRQKENLKKIRQNLEDHHRAHEDEKKAQERARFVQANLVRLHAAVKLHTFHRQISGKMQAMKQVADRRAAQTLADKIGRIEAGQARLHQAMSRKAVAHQDVEKHLLNLKADVDDALKELNKIKR